jgi:hypothetical protein
MKQPIGTLAALNYLNFSPKVVTVTGTNWTTTKAFILLHRLPDGKYYGILDVAGLISTPTSSITLTLSQLTFLTGIAQPLSVFTGVATYGNAACNTGGTTIDVATGSNISSLRLAGPVFLDSTTITI